MNGWINVKDRLPDDDAQCLALFSDGSVEVRSGASIAVLRDRASEFEVWIKYWMPISEPPEEMQND